MNYQTQLEAKRILAVVDDLVEDLAILSVLPSHLSEVPPRDLQKLVEAFPDEDGPAEVQQLLNDHFDMERRLDAAAAAATAPPGLVAAGGLPAASAEMTPEQIDDLHFSTRALVDAMRYAGFGGQAAPFGAEADQALNLANCRHTVGTLRELLQERLTTTVDDDVAKFTILNDTVNREKTASADVQALNREYAMEKESRRVEVARRNDAIAKLATELDSVKTGAELRHREFKDAATRHALSERERYQQELEALERKVEELEAEMKSTEGKCKDDEAQARQLRNKKEIQLSKVITVYDSEMTAGTEAVRGLQEEIDEDKEKLSGVEGDLAVLNAEAESYDLEQQLEERRTRHTIEITNRGHAMARIIQAFFRAHALRLDVATRGKKKKKGKKAK